MGGAQDRGWLLDASGAATTDALLAEQSALFDGYRKFLETLWREQDPRLLELCRMRIAAIHGATEVWSPVTVPPLQPPLTDAVLAALQVGLTDANRSLFTATERAALVVAELMPHGQHQISAAQTAALETVLGSPQAIALLTAMAFFDVSTRLSLSLGLAPGTDVPNGA